MRILVIEDEPTEMKLAHCVLEAAGHDVSGLEAADRALEAIREEVPDVVLLDLSLPGLDSLELVRRIRSDLGDQRVVVVAVTSFPEKYPKAMALESGCDTYLVKPLSTRTLSKDLDELVHNLMEIQEP